MGLPFLVSALPHRLGCPHIKNGGAVGGGCGQRACLAGRISAVEAPIAIGANPHNINIAS